MPSPAAVRGPRSGRGGETTYRGRRAGPRGEAGYGRPGYPTRTRQL